MVKVTFTRSKVIGQGHQRSKMLAVGFRCFHDIEREMKRNRIWTYWWRHTKRSLMAWVGLIPKDTQGPFCVLPSICVQNYTVSPENGSVSAAIHTDIKWYTLWQSRIGKQAVPHWASMLRWIWSISEYGSLKVYYTLITPKYNSLGWFYCMFNRAVLYGCTGRQYTQGT